MSLSRGSIGRWCGAAAGALALSVSVLMPAAHGEWVWTSETGWMSRKHIPKATAKEQLDYAASLHEREKYEKACVAFAVLSRAYPDSPLVEQAQFMQAECLFLMGRNVAAFNMYEKFLERYPDSARRGKAVEREVEAGTKLLEGMKKDSWGGLKLVRDREEGVRMIEKAIEHDPYHDRVPEALMRIATARFDSYRYADAKKDFSRIVEEYPKSEYRPEAEYRAILCDARATEDVRYDTSGCEQIEKKCKRLEAQNRAEAASENVEPATRGAGAAEGAAELAERAAELAETIRNRRAEKEFEIAEFYRNVGRTTAALTYYRLIVKNFEGTEWAGRAEEWIGTLSEQ